MDARRRGELMLEMVSGEMPPDVSRLARLGDADWAALDAMAGQHRLRPMLHDRWRGSRSVPAELRARWAAGYRVGTMAALAQRADLRRACAILAQAGFTPIALKGAFLAAHAYPAPALRPLRDLDILITAGKVEAAFALLLDAGYRRLDPAATLEAAADDKHMPTLVSPNGTAIELHRSLWEADGTRDHAMPRMLEPADVVARAVMRDGIMFPCAEDMLTHLIVHAIYSHRLDCGPLLLWDVFHLARTQPIDWRSLWRRAGRERWSDGAALVLGLVRRWRAESIPRATNEPPPPPAPLLDGAADLLLQDLDTRRSAGVVATAAAGGRKALARRMIPAAVALPRASTSIHYAAWALPRFGRTLRELASPAVRGQARRLTRISRWLGQ